MKPAIRFTVIITALLATSGVAFAGLSAKTTGTLFINTGKYSVAPEGTTSGTSNGALVWSSVASGSNLYFYYRNTGDFPIAAFSWSITRTSGTGSFTVYKCPINTTFTSSTLCSDSSTPTSMNKTGTGPALTPGQWLPVLIRTTVASSSYSASSTISSSQRTTTGL